MSPLPLSMPHSDILCKASGGEGERWGPGRKLLLRDTSLCQALCYTLSVHDLLWSSHPWWGSCWYFHLTGRNWESDQLSTNQCLAQPNFETCWTHNPWLCRGNTSMFYHPTLWGYNSWLSGRLRKWSRSWDRASSQVEDGVLQEEAPKPKFN